jgi:Ca-activated chloride channel family protein
LDDPVAVILRFGVAVSLVSLLTSSAPAQADFIDWWLTPDQQGRIAFQRGEYARAAQHFSDPLWKGMAYYASGDFANAAAYFAMVQSAYGRFYLGNALAHAGELREAIAAYQSALESEPGLEAATFNLQWVEGLADLENKEYEDAGGTGGKLGADDYVFSDRAKNAQQTMSAREAASQGLSDAQIEEIWMRRVQTTPAEFLAVKFAQQLNRASP